MKKNSNNWTLNNFLPKLQATTSIEHTDGNDRLFHVVLPGTAKTKVKLNILYLFCRVFTTFKGTTIIKIDQETQELFCYSRK